MGEISGQWFDEGHSLKITPTHALAVHKNSGGQKFPRQPMLLYYAYEVPNPYDPKHTVLKYRLVGETRMIGPKDIFVPKPETPTPSVPKKDVARMLILGALSRRNGDGPMAGAELLASVMETGISERAATNVRVALAKEGKIKTSRNGGANGQVVWRLA